MVYQGGLVLPDVVQVYQPVLGGCYPPGDWWWQRPLNAGLSSGSAGLLVQPLSNL